MWSFTEILSGLLLLTASMDRLLSVTFPLQYITWSATYVMMLFGSTYVYAIVTGTVMSLALVNGARDEAIHLNTTVAKSCYSVSHSMIVGVNEYYVSYRRYAAVVFALSSIIIYVLIWILYKQHQNRVCYFNVIRVNKANGFFSDCYRTSRR